MGRDKVKWKYDPEHHGEAEFARFYAHGASLEEVCPEMLSEELEHRSERIQSFLSSFHRTGIKWRQIGLERLVPNHVLESFYDIRDQVAEYVVSTYDRPDCYEFYENLSYVCSQISEQTLNKNFSNVIQYREDSDYERFLGQVRYKDRIYYDIFGSKTGRLGMEPGSFPILTLKKKYRDLLEPKNDWFVEFDYESAELRTALALVGHEQPEKDLHAWNQENAFDGDISRSKSKKRVFSWLYGGKRGNKSLSEIYNREKLLKDFWDGEKVINPYGREIESDRSHAISYLVQSSFADYFLRKVVSVHDMLASKQTNLAFCIHDSVILDLKWGEHSPIIKGVREELEVDQRPVSIRAGKSFGSLENLDF